MRRRHLAVAAALVVATACGPDAEGPDPAREDPQAPEDPAEG
jgi:hypothetical protein